MVAEVRKDLLSGTKAAAHLACRRAALSLVVGSFVAIPANFAAASSPFTSHFSSGGECKFIKNAACAPS
jgi:hypothetical protein